MDNQYLGAPKVRGRLEMDRDNYKDQYNLDPKVPEHSYAMERPFC